MDIVHNNVDKSKKEYQRKWYQENKEKVVAWQRNNPGKVYLSKHKWYEKNKSKVKASYKRRLEKTLSPEVLAVRVKLAEIYAEIEQLRNQQDNTKSIELQKEYQMHIDDLRLQAYHLRKSINRKERSTPKHKGKLPLPDFCFNHKRVAKSLEGMTW